MQDIPESQNSGLHIFLLTRGYAQTCDRMSCVVPALLQNRTCLIAPASLQSLSYYPQSLEFYCLLQMWKRRMSEAQERVKRNQILLSCKVYMCTWLPFACLKISQNQSWTFNAWLEKNTYFSESGHWLLFFAFKTTKKNREIYISSLAPLWPRF